VIGGGLEYRREVDGVDAQLLQVRNAFDDALEIAAEKVLWCWFCRIPL
jgi:hypothetical protein